MRLASKVCASLILFGGFAPVSVRAVILDSSGDPSFNTTAPTGSLADSGWQYEGQWGGFLGTAIAPQYFITAEHVGGGIGQIFSLGGVDYTTTAYFDDPTTDLRIWQISGTFTTYAPLYAGTEEVGKSLVVIGRGTQRGTERSFNNGARGWNWGTPDSVERWGTNQVAATRNFGGGLGDLLIADFDHLASDTEAHLSSGDSGGAVFIHDSDGVWKLAGINYAVDGPFYTSATGAGEFIGALYDTTGFYVHDSADTYVPATGPSSFYASRISSSLDFVNGVLAPTPVPEPSATSVLMVWLCASATLGRSLGRRSQSLAAARPA